MRKMNGLNLGRNVDAVDPNGDGGDYEGKESRRLAEA